MTEYKIGYFDDIVDIDDYIERNGEFISNSEIVDILNEQDETIQKLRRTMKGVAELLSIDADLFSDKAIEHDMNAYIELKEFDNKDVYCMAVSIKKAIKMLKGDINES